MKTKLGEGAHIALTKSSLLSGNAETSKWAPCSVPLLIVPTRCANQPASSQFSEASTHFQVACFLQWASSSSHSAAVKVGCEWHSAGTAVYFAFFVWLKGKKSTLSKHRCIQPVVLQSSRHARQLACNQDARSHSMSLV